MVSVEVSTTAFTGYFDIHSAPARLTLTTTGASFSHADQEQFLNFFGQIAQAKIQFTAVFDLRKIGFAPPSMIRSLGEWCKSHEQEFKEVQLAIAILLASNFWAAATRRIIGVVTSICPPACPLLMDHSVESAERFFSEKVDLGSNLKPAPVDSVSDHIPDISFPPTPNTPSHVPDDDVAACQPRCFGEVRLHVGSFGAAHCMVY